MNTRHGNRNNNRKGKRNKQSVVNDRWEKKEERGGRSENTHPKFQERNNEYVESRPLQPMNQQQAEYIHNLRTKPYNIAIGYAGTSKTYIPTRIAIEKYLKGEIERIIIVRPAVSDSKSLGFYAGDLVTKAKNWILPVLDVLEEFLGKSRVEYMILHGHIVPVPLETIKGRSFNDCFIIVDEAEDITKKEFIKCITRLGKNATMVFAGDLRQVDIRDGSGLDFGLDLAEYEDMWPYWGVVDFDEPLEIVRSVPVKKVIIRLTEMNEM